MTGQTMDATMRSYLPAGHYELSWCNNSKAHLRGPCGETTVSGGSTEDILSMFTKLYTDAFKEEDHG